MTMTANPRAFADAERTSKDYVCDCGGELVVRSIDGDWRAVCSRDADHADIRSRTDVQAAEMRARLEQDPRLVQSLALTGARIPLTTQAIRELDDQRLLLRIPDRYGTSDNMAVTPVLRKQIAQAARIYGLDPVFDLMVYESRLYVTYDGRLRKLRENPNLLPPRTRFCTAADKEGMGYDPADIVVECAIDHRGGGAYTDWGVVRREEIDKALTKAQQDKRRPAPVTVHPQHIALKRAIARASRQAAGLDLPTFDNGAGQVIEGVVREMTPARPALPADDFDRRRFWAVARGSAGTGGLGLTDDQVHALLGVESLNGYPGGWAAALETLSERAAQAQAAAVELATDAGTTEAPPEPRPAPAAVDLVNKVRDADWQAYVEQSQAATNLDVSHPDLRLPVDREQVRAETARLRDAIARKKLDLADPQPPAETESLDVQGLPF